MAKTYREYCLESLKTAPDVYKSYLLPDGRPKPFPSFAGFFKRKIKDIPREELKALPKDGFHGWPINNIKTKVKTEAKIKITGTQLFMSGKQISMEILPLPSGQGMRAYNKVWMHNYRVRCRIRKLKDKFGITFEL
jgi:hypothetical protein